MGASARRMTITRRKGNFTAGGVPIPTGWNLQRLDTFGTSNSVRHANRLRALYTEAIFFGQDGSGRVMIPNTTINSQQQQYQHFDDPTWVFNSDRLTIQGRGQVNNTIKSGQMVNKLSFRSWIVEARLTAPATPGSWAAFWNYNTGLVTGDTSEFDVEIVMSNPPGSGSNLGVNDVSIGNFPYAVVNIVDSHVTQDVPAGSGLLLYRNASFNVSTGPHYYTILYDDTGPGMLKRYLDGVLLYTVVAKWNASLGGTGFGPDAVVITDLSVGGAFPGNVTPSTYSGNLDIYSLSVYTPGAAGRAVPAAQAWGFGNSHITLSGGDLIASTATTANQVILAFDPTIGTGKYYWEVVVNGSGAVPGAGIAMASTPVVDGDYLGRYNTGIGWFSGGGVTTNNNFADTWAAYGPGSTRLCFALDMTNFKLWGRVGAGGNWNNAAIGSQNPATNTGGYAIPGSIRFEVYPAANLGVSGDTVTGVFASASFAGTPPAGFGTFT